MGIGASLFMLAAGAILAFAVDFTLAGIDIYVVGIILMVVGGLGLILSLVFMSGQRRRVVREEPLDRDRSVVREERRDVL
jgi:hypothetical protein